MDVYSRKLSTAFSKKAKRTCKYQEKGKTEFELVEMSSKGEEYMNCRVCNVDMSVASCEELQMKTATNIVTKVLTTYVDKNVP
ncbi:hypothetical protein DPMN_169530 [Dreissena polymorpha]|uniref:Uncharacterized protein n=1 Tax=Dreissena polymorpha TaxID=45954 RepID=A0A9D4IDQ0_DREPO|nr:hypothetical protein DPMN_169530 [Dreissena polymorpha]